MSAIDDSGVVPQIAVAVARTFWKLVAVTAGFALIVGAAVVRTTPVPEYEASALVIANHLAIRPEGLPRFAEAVFQGGAVAERATSEPNPLPFAASRLIPQRAHLEPFENTVIMAVVGNAEDPQLAATVANRVASEFVAELAKAGPGVGEFSIQDRARPPDDPLPRTGPLTGAAVGLVAGATLAGGLLALWLLTRRPLLTPSDAAKATGSGVIAVLVLGRARRGSAVWGEPVPGAAAVARQLFPDLAGMAAVVSPPAAVSERSRVAMMVARVLSHSSVVHLVTSSRDIRAATAPDDHVVMTADVPGGRVWAASPVLVDGPSEYDLPLLAPPNGRLALVVAEGLPRAEVERLAAQFLPGELLGVVFTRPARGFRGPRRPSRPVGSHAVTQPSDGGRRDTVSR